MKTYALIVDVEKCENCNNCFLSCKDEHCGNDWPGYAAPQPPHGHRWMNIKRRERGTFPMIDVAYRPTPCMHCDDPPCLAAAEHDAVVKRDDGIVLILPERARGQRGLAASCPYGAIWWNEELQLPQKCTFCAHLLDSGWQQPRCVQSCPTGALSLFTGDSEQLQNIVVDEGLQVLPVGSGAHPRPRVYYKNLYRYDRCFIGGTVARMREGVEECADGVSVVLRQGRDLLAEAVTDEFGDFRFDNLVRDSGDYLVEIVVGDTIAAARPFSLGVSGSLGTIMLE